MDGLLPVITALVKQPVLKITLSAPRAGHNYIKASLAPVKEGQWRIERFTKTQVFHQNFAAQQLADVLASLLQQEFSQLHAFGGGWQQDIRITKKGRVLTNRQNKPDACPAPQTHGGHNRAKKYILPEGEAIAPLVDMGVFTQDGRVAKPMYDKYRQINRFLEQVDDLLKNWEKPDIYIIDFGCGKSYLTFLLYHYLSAVKGLKAHITGLDLKKDVVESCNAAAQKYGYDALHFEVGDIAGYHFSHRLDMVVTLHACDTATDHALANAVKWGAKMIFSVPCCQHELNSQIQGGELALLTRYGIVKERTASLMTDAIRANLLVACGYKTQLLEFVDFTHTPKNILIRAVKTGQPKAQKQKAVEEVNALCRAFSLQPALQALLKAELDIK